VAGGLKIDFGFAGAGHAVEEEWLRRVC
jgi:hypothetical protein